MQSIWITKFNLIYFQIDLAKSIFVIVHKIGLPRVEISLSFFILSWVLVGPGLEFLNIEKTDRGPVRCQ